MKKSRSGSEKRQRKAVKLIRFSDQELAEIEEAASRAGLTFSSFGRAKMLGSVPVGSVRRPPIERELLARTLGQLGKVGSNLNQIARAAHLDRSDRAEIMDAVIELRGLLPQITEALGQKAR